MSISMVDSISSENTSSSVSSEVKSSVPDSGSSTTGNEQIDKAVTAGVEYIKSAASVAANEAAKNAVDQFNKAKDDDKNKDDKKPTLTGGVENGGGTKADKPATTPTEAPKK